MEKSPAHYRCRLLAKFLDMKLSHEIQLDISRIIKPYEESQKEQKAKEVLELLENCNNEDDVIKAMKGFK